MKKSGKNRILKWHKWLGLPFAFFALMFAISGIVMNHRHAVSGIDVPRKWLPTELKVRNWNLGSVKGTIRIGSSDSVLMYGAGGVWLTDTLHSTVSQYMAGMKEGADNRTVSKIVMTDDGQVFASTTFDLYRLDCDNWLNLSDKIDTHERLTDVAICGDTLVVVSRSELYISLSPYQDFKKVELLPPHGYDGKVSLFRTIWRLHSGELFGSVGKILVDILGVVVAVLSLTGLVIFLFPKIIKRRKKKEQGVRALVETTKKSYKWHNKAGYWLLPLLLILFISGMMLRPPLLLTIIYGRTKPIPFSTLDSRNAWNDRLRCLQYDTIQHEWLLYSSEGFYSLKTLESTPLPIEKAPLINVMGVNVLQRYDSTQWVVGSFDGLFLWDRTTGVNRDFISGEEVAPRRPGPPDTKIAISGFSSDFSGKTIVFGYGNGAVCVPQNNPDFIQMNDVDSPGRISLWHLCLEIHTGRIYKPVIGFFSGLFVFISGVSLVVISLTGYVLYRRKKLRNPLTKARFSSFR